MPLTLRGPDGQPMTVEEASRLMASPEFRFAGLNKNNWAHFAAGEIQRMQIQRDAINAPRMSASEQVAIQDTFRQMAGLDTVSNKQLANYRQAQAQRLAANPLLDYASGVDRVLGRAGTDVLSVVAPKTAAKLQRNIGYKYGEQAQGMAGKAGEFLGSIAQSVPAILGGPLGTAAIAGFGVRGFGSARAQAEAAREAEMSGELPCTAVHGGAGWHAREWTVRRALRTPQFWMLWVAGFCQLGLAEKVAIAHQVYFFRDAGYSPAAAASVYAVFGAMFVAGTLASSLSDRMGRERLYVPACALALVGVGLLFVIPGSSVSWLPYVFAVCFGIGMGIMPPVLFASVADLFHGKSYGGIQGTVALGFSLGGAIGPWVAGHMHDVLGSYDSTLVMLVGALLASGLLVILAAPGRHSSVC